MAPLISRLVQTVSPRHTDLGTCLVCRGAVREAADAVRLSGGGYVHHECATYRMRERAVRIEIAMNNSSGLFQVDELLATKLRGSGLEPHV